MTDPVEAGLILPRRLARLEAVSAQRLHHLAVILDNLQDPHNASAILRSCDAFGVQNVYVIERDRQFDISTGVSHGCERWLTIHRVECPHETLRQLKAEGFRILSADPADDALPLHEQGFVGKVALVFGNETSGIDRATRPYCDGRFVIPMVGFSRSLNVSVAAAVALWHATQQRRRSLGDETSDDPAAREALLDFWVTREVQGKMRANVVPQPKRRNCPL